MDSRINTADRLSILYRTGIKLFRGGGTQNLLKRSSWNASDRERRADFPR